MENREINLGELVNKANIFVHNYGIPSYCNIESGFMSKEYKEMVTELERITLDTLKLSKSELKEIFATKSVKLCPVVKMDDFCITVMFVHQDT